MIEACMIAEGKRDHHLPRLLSNLVEWNIVLLKDLRANQRHFVSQESVTLGVVFSESQVRKFLELATLGGWNCIPRLRGT